MLNGTPVSGVPLSVRTCEGNCYRPMGHPKASARQGTTTAACARALCDELVSHASP